MDDLRFALINRLDDVQPKPTGYPDLASLARAIERDRKGRPLELVEREDFEFQSDTLLHTVVEVWTLDMANSPETLLAVAWLNERGRETLEPALRAVRQDRPRAEPRRRAA